MEQEITFEEYQNLIKEQVNWEYYNDFGSYRKLNNDETFEYMRLHSYETGLNVNILLDDEASFEKRNHPLWLYIQNGYDDTNDILPISISKNPQLLVPIERVKINYDDIEKIKMFIIRNFELLEKYGCGNISHTSLFKFLKKGDVLNESTMILEMSKLYKEVTGLDTPIWVDIQRNIEHGPRIKFKGNGKKNTGEWNTMTINDKNPIVIDEPSNVIISDKEIERIKKFVVYNYDILLRLSTDNTMNFDKEFKPYVIKVGENGGAILPPARQKLIDQNSDKTVKVNFEYIEEKIYLTITSDNETNSAILYNQLLKNELFKKYDSDTLYVLNQDYDRDQFVNMLLKIIKSTSKANNLNVKFLNTQSIIF